MTKQQLQAEKKYWGIVDNGEIIEAYDSKILAELRIKELQLKDCSIHEVIIKYKD